MVVSWERRHEALKAIHDKIAEILTTVLTVLIQKRGTPTRKTSTTSVEVVAAPGAGKKLRVHGYFLKVDADEIVTLRHNGASGDIFAGLPTKGVIIANLLVDEAGGDNQNIFLQKSGAGNVDVVVYTETENA